MTRFLIFCALLFSLPALFCAQLSSFAGGEPLELGGYISAWTQDCTGGKCSLPRPGEVNRPVRLRLGLPSSPGEAAVAGVSEKFVQEAGAELAAEINLYAVCPYVGKNSAAGSTQREEKSPLSVPLSEDKCAGRYFQAQVSLSGVAEAFCSAALNYADLSPWPVLLCAGSARPGQRAGVTLHRRPF